MKAVWIDMILRLSDKVNSRPNEVEISVQKSGFFETKSKLSIFILQSQTNVADFYVKVFKRLSVRAAHVTPELIKNARILHHDNQPAHTVLKM